MAKKSEVICFCNNISKEVIEKAISEGADTLNKIFDRTTAGVGACGGSCRKKLAPILDTYLKKGTFPPAAETQKRNRKNKNSGS